MNKKIFDQEQIARAGEIGLGVTAPDQIDLIATDDGSLAYRNRIAAILKKG